MSYVSLSSPSPILDVNILVAGKPVQKYVHDNNVFIEARKGTEYKIKVENKGWRRLLANVTVDGLSVMDGKEGDASKQVGYVIPAYSSITIDGWRLNDNEVAAFKFGDLGGSYAAQKGKPRNVGVIGVAVFEEKLQPVIPTISYYNVFNTYDWSTPYGGTGGVAPCGVNITTTGAMPEGGITVCSNSCDYDAAASSLKSMDCMDSSRERGISTNQPIIRSRSRMGAATKSKSVTMAPEKVAGTEFGAKLSSGARTVEFETATVEPQLITSVQYKFGHELEKMGIELNPPTYVVRDQTPNPFPVSQGCQPPSGWDPNKR